MAMLFRGRLSGSQRMRLASFNPSNGIGWFMPDRSNERNHGDNGFNPSNGIGWFMLNGHLFALEVRHVSIPQTG